MAEAQILVVDVGGNNIKIKHAAHVEKRKTKSGPEMTPERMVDAVRKLAGDWRFDHVTIGYPGPVREGRLVLEPPAPDAPGVAAIVEASDGVEIRAQALVAARSYLAIPLFLPLLWWLGIHAAAVPLAVAALGSAAAAVSLLVSRGRWLRAWVWVSLAGNAVMMVLFSRMFGPLLAVPAMASTLGMTAMTVPGLRPWPLLPVLLVAAVLGPWAAEALGWLQPTTWIEHDALVVTSSVIDLPRGPTLAVLAIHTVTLTAIAAHYMRQLTQVNRDARLRLLSQAWLLEQLAAGDDGAA